MTFTKERLLKIKTWRETYGPESNVVLPAEEAEALAEIALAALESRADAEPVGYYRLADDGVSYYLSSPTEHRDGCIPLYTRPQPAPVVPDAYVRDERGRMMLNGVCESRIGFGFGWNACRAAMLQGKAEPVSQPYTLPECFDRLFKHAQGLTFGDDWNRGTAAKYHRDSLIKAVDDCRAMLAAAPQQEAE